jgi:YHS domain-containing protein
MLINSNCAKLAIAALAFCLVSIPLFAQPDMAQPKLANANAPLVSIDRWKQALAGHDPVAYFDYGEPTPGTREFHTSHNGVYYSFASKVTRKKFLSAPGDYLPQFGGYCALSLALAEGELAERPAGLYPADPKLFKVVNGRLYLFASDLGFDAIERWNANESEYLARAEANWKSIVELRK